MFDDQSPIYRQIADRIRQDILAGRIEEEEQVMSTNQYAAFYRINPATAQKAFQSLVDAGVLYKKRGIGMFVSTGARAALQQEHRARFYRDVLDPVLAEARAIGIPFEEITSYIENDAVKESIHEG